MSTTKYRCVNCDQVFEVGEGAEDEPRCPKCHRVHDVVPLAGPAKAPWFRRNTTVGAAALLGILGAGVIIYAVRGSSTKGQNNAAPTIPAASRGELTLLTSQVPAGADVDLVLGKTSGSADARARALGKVLRQLVDGGKMTVTDAEAPAELMERELLDPVPLLQRLGQGTPPAVTSLEAALLALRLARAAGLQAEVVRVERFADRNAPADPSGLFGHYAVSVAGTGASLLLDPTTAGGVAAGTAETKPVSDAACGGILEAYRALKAFMPRPDRPKPDALAADEHLQKAKSLAPDWAPVHMVAAFIALAQEPGRAFGEVDAVLRGATPSEKVAVAELYAGLGRIAAAEKLLGEGEKVYPGWARIPLVRAQIALFRAGALVLTEMTKANPDMVPAAQLDQLQLKLQALGLSDADRPEDQFAILRQNLEEAERRGGSRSVGRIRDMYGAAFAEYRLARGDVDGARKVLEETIQAYPASPNSAVPLAALLIAQQGDENAARKVLEPAAHAAQASVDDLLKAAQALADRIKTELHLGAAPPGANPFDLSAPTTGVPSTEPSLTMPSLGARPSGGLGQGLQLRF